MLMFLDTEFTDFKDCDLISIGLISEDGKHEFYAERTDFNYEYCNDFVRSAVWAHLGEFPEAKVKKHQLTECLWQWITQLPYDLIIARDSMTDWELMLDALASPLPINIKGYLDLSPIVGNSVFNVAVTKYHEDGKHPYHHALHDARASRKGWLAWSSHTDSDRAVCPLYFLCPTDDD